MEVFRKYFDEHNDPAHQAQPGCNLHIVTVGHSIHPAGASYPDLHHPGSHYFTWEEGRRLKEFQLVYISHGRGLFEAEGVPPAEVKAGTAFLLFPDTWHRYKPSEETGWEEFWVGYNGLYADYLMQQKCFRRNSPFIHIDTNSELLNVFLQLIETLKQENYEQLATCQMSQLLALVYASAVSNDAQRQQKNDLIHAARFIIHENIDKNINMEEIAKKLNVSYPWFRRTFREVIGVAPGKYHLNLRIERAGKMLRQTHLSVAEIAYTLGFESEFYFSRIFKKKTGLPPRQFRIEV